MFENNTADGVSTEKSSNITKSNYNAEISRQMNQNFSSGLSRVTPPYSTFLPVQIDKNINSEISTQMDKNSTSVEFTNSGNFSSLFTLTDTILTSVTTSRFNSTTTVPHYQSEADEFSQNISVSMSLSFKWHGAELMFLIFILLLSVVGNLLVMYIYHFRWKRSNFSLFIEVLAMLDLINGCTTVPMFIALSVNDKIHAFHNICQAASFMAMATGVSSGICLLTIAFDRNRKICKPLKPEFPLRLTKIVCSGAVIIGTLISIPSVFLYGQKKIQYIDNETIINVTECFFTEKAKRSPFLFAFNGILGMIFTAILICLTYFYISIWKALRIHLQHRESLGSRRSSTSSRHQSFRSQRSSARLFFFVTVAFFMSYFPYFVFMSTMMFIDIPHMTVFIKSLTDIAKYSPLLSNVINPVIYSATSTRFRNECIAVLFQCGGTLKGRRWTKQGSKNSKHHYRSHTSSASEEMMDKTNKTLVQPGEKDCSTNGTLESNELI